MEERVNGRDLSDEPIPMPETGFKTDESFDTHSSIRSKRMPPAKQTFIQQYGTIIVAVILAVVPVVALFAVMQYRIGQLEQKHKEDMDKMAADFARDKQELNQRIADAQAYGNSALSQSKFVQGILLGKGVLNSNDITQIQNQK